MQITNYTNSLFSGEINRTASVASAKVAVKEQNASETVASRSFDTFEYSASNADVGTTYSPDSLASANNKNTFEIATNSVTAKSGSSSKLSIRGLIARKAGVPITSYGEPYINNGTDASKYNKTLQSYNSSKNKAVFFANIDVYKNGNAILETNADKAAYNKALYEYTNALGVADKIESLFPYAQYNYPKNSTVEYPKGACAAFSYAAALSYLTDSTVDPANLKLESNSEYKYTAIADWNYTDPDTKDMYSVKRYYQGENMTNDKDTVFAEIDQQLGKGNVPILFHVKNAVEGEHWALITGKNENGEYQVFDPYYGKIGTLDDMVRYSEKNCTYEYCIITVQ